MALPESESLGARIRRLRRTAGKTLQEVALEAGVTAGFLSLAERGLTGVSLSSLANIAKALKIPAAELFDAPLAKQPDSHAGQRLRYQLDGQAQSYERLSTSFPGSKLDATKMLMPVGYQSETVAHDGDEFVYVLSGQVALNVGAQAYALSAGDSLHFDARQPHQVRTMGALPAELLYVTTLRVFPDTADSN